jgi:hypothetical protein
MIYFKISVPWTKLTNHRQLSGSVFHDHRRFSVFIFRVKSAVVWSKKDVTKRMF